jgi:hypothetical protein
LSTELERAIGRVVEGTRHWSPARWLPHADTMHGLVQALADIAADVEGRAHRPVPRLPNDMSLPDQLQVVGVDLIELEPLKDNEQAKAERAIQEARSSLF